MLDYFFSNQTILPLEYENGYFLHFFATPAELPPFPCSREIGYASKIRLPLKKLIPHCNTLIALLGSFFIQREVLHIIIGQLQWT